MNLTQSNVKVGDLIFVERPITRNMLGQGWLDREESDDSPVRVPLGEMGFVVRKHGPHNYWDAQVSWPNNPGMPDWNVKLAWFTREDPLRAYTTDEPLALGLAKVRAR